MAPNIWEIYKLHFGTIGFRTKEIQHRKKFGRDFVYAMCHWLLLGTVTNKKQTNKQTNKQKNINPEMKHKAQECWIEKEQKETRAFKVTLLFDKKQFW